MSDTRTSGNRTAWIIGTAGGLVVVLLIAAVIFGNNEVGAEYGTPTVTGEPLPQMPQLAIDTSATGLTPPTVEGADFDGTSVTIDPDDGRAKGIVFLAHWCSHCQEEAPRVQEWLDSGGGVDGVDLYSVATSINSGRDNYPPSAWLDRLGWTVPNIVDDQELSALIGYGAGGFPYWVFLNADGSVALRTSGQLQIEQLEEILGLLEQ